MAPKGVAADYIGLFAVTAGIGVEKKEKQFTDDHDDYSAIMLKALADRLAEAFAERLHQRVRTELWGYAADEALSNEDLIAEKYRGIRPAPGYPACPDHSVKRDMFRVLRPTEIGMGLTESLAMTPAASVSGFYLAHPEATYFNVGRIGEDQLRDWAVRQAVAVEQAQRWLAPVLPEIAPAGTRLPRGTGGGVRREQPLAAAKGCPGGARRACEAPSSAGFMARARSAPRDLTWRICLSVANEVSEASYAPGHGPEQRRAVGALAETASVARRASPGRPFAATRTRTHERTVNVRNGPLAALQRPDRGTPHSATKAVNPIAAVSHRAPTPQRSSARPNNGGAAACSTRAGSVIQPWRAP
jgi:hypothetical protein